MITHSADPAPTPDVPLDWVRLSARAAELITALSHPDLAALVAAAPRRPGTAIPADELRQSSGLGLKPFAAAVSRGRNAHVLSAPQPGQLAVDSAAVESVVSGLAALAPLGALVAARPELRRYARFGRLTEMPDDPDQRAALYDVIVELVPAGDDLIEGEVNQRLLLASDDPATLRRDLVESGRLDRTPDGASYRRR